MINSLRVGEVRRARPLATGCAFCNKQDGLKICGSCKAAYFCCEEHKAAMGIYHLDPCEKVREWRPQLVQYPFIDPTGGNVHPHDADTDTLIHNLAYANRWMTCRTALAQCLGGINTRLAAEERLELLIEIIPMNIYAQVTICRLMIGLDRDLEAYDLIKRSILGSNKQYANGQIFKPDQDWFKDKEEADPWEDVTYMRREGIMSNFAVYQFLSVALMKVKMLMDLETIQEASCAFGFKVPLEIFNIICSFAAISPITQIKGAIQDTDNQREQIDVLRQQIRFLYDTVDNHNKAIWPCLISGERLFVCVFSFQVWAVGPPPNWPYNTDHLPCVGDGCIAEAWVTIPGALARIARFQRS
ncbi:uncharacterized protein KD926_009763 [Aspergillus affinis]|uniref:uncharacterized protein n=1 Tax=Aspergillus affinis TaxID=1070780 RepID=UPI0022FEC9AC|nr:uncharacterized protein KD926_009763 [Aspergillus affinis]KAI9039321.1 hypothetical protein KD926_009763 [Aspergillus affinis]